MFATCYGRIAPLVNTGFRFSGETSTWKWVTISPRTIVGSVQSHQTMAGVRTSGNGNPTLPSRTSTTEESVDGRRAGAAMTDTVVEALILDLLEWLAVPEP